MGKNDSRTDAEELARVLKNAFRGTGAPIHVNLIRVNEVSETGFKRGDERSVNAFAARLGELGITATVRRRLGADVNGACGQLRRKKTESEGEEIELSEMLEIHSRSEANRHRIQSQCKS